jgi:hypothetical protein
LAGTIVSPGGRPRSSVKSTSRTPQTKRCTWTELDDYAAFNKEYAKHFPRDKPVRTIVRADLVAGMHVEIRVDAKQP